MEINISIRNIKQIGSSLTRTIPFYSSIPAGFPSPAADYMQDSIFLNALLAATLSATSFVKVEGESMIDAFIPPKAMLIIDRSITPSSGDIIVAVVNGTFTVKRYIKTSSQVCLASAKRKFQSIEITEEMCLMVWGVLSKIIIDNKDIA